MRTAREQNIEQVAGIIYDYRYENPDWDGSGPSEEELNECGWGFDVNYDYQEYPGGRENNWTRVRGLTLSREDLMKAQALAEQLNRGLWPR
jgi:hypothetical protein